MEQKTGISNPFYTYKDGGAALYISTNIANKV